MRIVLSFLFLSVTICLHAQNIGIGETSPQARLHVKGAGIDYATATLLLQNSSGTTLINVRDNGYTGIGTSVPFARLHVKENFETMRIEGNSSYISFYDGSTYKGYLWQKAGTAIELGTASGSNLPVTIAPNNYPEATFLPGYTGIGNSNPSYRLDVSGRMRIRATSATETAGVWLNNSTNTSRSAFVGMNDDNTYGFYTAFDDFGYWPLLISRTTGGIGINHDPDTSLLSIQGGLSVLDIGSYLLNGSALKINGGSVGVIGAGINTFSTVAFVHKANASNTLVGSGYTVINNTFCNNNPAAILQVTMNATYGSGALPGYEVLAESTTTGGSCQVLTPTSFMVFYNGPNSGYYPTAPAAARDKWCIRVYTGCFISNPLNYNFNVFVIKPN